MIKDIFYNYKMKYLKYIILIKSGNFYLALADDAKILNNILGYSATAGMHYNDEIPAWAQTSIDALRELGIYPVSGGAANPAAMLTKEDTAKMLFNLMTLLDE